MLNMYKERYPDGINEAARILEENIICGDSLKIMKQWADEEKENECEKTEINSSGSTGNETGI